MIRKARMGDLVPLKEIIGEAWRTYFERFPVNDLKLTRAVHQFMSDKRRAMFVSEVNGEIVGVIAGEVSPMMVSDEKAAEEYIFFCKSGEGRELLKAYVEWAKDQGATLINVCVSSGDKRSGRLIESAGFRCAGGNYYHE